MSTSFVQLDSISQKKILHFTDIHIDFNYTEYAEPFCIDMQCCRVTYDSSINFAFDMFKDQKDKLIGVLNSGDFVGRDFDHQSHEKNLRHLKVGFQKLFDKFEQPVIGALGNHDSFPVDNLDFRPGGAWLLDVMYDLFSRLFVGEKYDKAQLQNLKNYGFYSFMLTKSLRIIVLNHFWSDTKNYFMKGYPEMVHHQTKWLRSELSFSKEKNYKVIILGHYAPGIQVPFADMKSFEKNNGIPKENENYFMRLTKEYNSDFERICADFSSTILLQLYGHVHVDTFQIIYSLEKLKKNNFKVSEDVATSVSLIAPGVVTNWLKNPAIKLIKIDVKNNVILDVVTFINDIRKSNEEKSMENNWKLEYSLADFFNLTSITPQSMFSAQQKMKVNTQVYEDFQNFHFCSFIKNVCSGFCKKELFCSMSYITQESYEFCVNSTKI